MPDYTGGDHSKDTYKVVSGYHHHRDESGNRERLGPGDTFHPTLKQVRDGSLENKAVKVEEGGTSNTTTVAENIGLRSLEWGHPAALDKALDTQPRLTVQEMEDAGATGSTGFVSADVERALEARD